MGGERFVPEDAMVLAKNEDAPDASVEAVEGSVAVEAADMLGDAMGEMADDNVFIPRSELRQVAREAPSDSMKSKLVRAVAKVALFAALVAPFGTAATAEAAPATDGVEETESGLSEKIKGYAAMQLEIVKASSPSAVYNEAKSVIDSLLEQGGAEDVIFDGINATIKEVMNQITPDVAEVEKEVKEVHATTSELLSEYRLAEDNEEQVEAVLEKIGLLLASGHPEHSTVIVSQSWQLDGQSSQNSREEFLLDSSTGDEYTIEDASGRKVTFKK